MAIPIGPVVLSVQGDRFLEGARVSGVIWEGTTTPGDTIELRCPSTNALLWAGRASDTQTYLGVNIGPGGVHAPFGFTLTQISSGRLLVYLREE